MYSIVLMVAMSHSTAVPAWQNEAGISVAKRYGDSGRYEYRHRRGGCHGCCGGGYGGCCGGGYYGRSYGCCGGGHYGRSYGCCGGGYYGAGCYGSGCSGGGYYSGETVIPSAESSSSSSSSYYGQATEVTQSNDRATIVVHLPAEAKLMIDDGPTTSTSEVRTFISPPLEQGKKFHYTLKAEFNRDGKPVTQTKEITVEAGKSVDVDLSQGSSAQSGAEKAKKEQKTAEPKKAEEPKPNSGQGAQPKGDSGQGAQPKTDSGQPQAKPNANPAAEPKP